MGWKGFVGKHAEPRGDRKDSLCVPHNVPTGYLAWIFRDTPNVKYLFMLSFHVHLSTSQIKSFV